MMAVTLLFLLYWSQACLVLFLCCFRTLFHTICFRGPLYCDSRWTFTKGCLSCQLVCNMTCYTGPFVEHLWMENLLCLCSCLFHLKSQTTTQKHRSRHMLCEVFQKYILERHQTNSCALLPWICPVALFWAELHPSLWPSQVFQK